MRKPKAQMRYGAVTGEWEPSCDADVQAMVTVVVLSLPACLHLASHAQRVLWQGLVGPHGWQLAALCCGGHPVGTVLVQQQPASPDAS